MHKHTRHQTIASLTSYSGTRRLSLLWTFAHIGLTSCFLSPRPHLCLSLSPSLCLSLPFPLLPIPSSPPSPPRPPQPGVKNFGDAYLLDTELWEWSRGPESLLGADAAGLRVGHTALLARVGGGSSSRGNDSGDGDDEDAAADEGVQMKAAFFGGQDGADVRHSDLALLAL